jgi:hypothetical protein
MAWEQRPSVLIKEEGSTSAYKGRYLVNDRECDVEANIDN